MDTLLCEIRYAEDPSRQSPGRIVGELVIYEKQARDRKEIFTRGSLTFPPDGILITEQHNRQAPILRATPFVDGDRVLIDAAVPDTQRGRDAVTNVREGVFKGLSIEFQSRSEGRRGALREIRAAYVPYASLVDSPSHDTHVEVRSESGLILPSAVTLWL